MDTRVLLPASVRTASRPLVLAALLLSFVILPMPLSAQDEPSELALADELYERGEYRQALQAFDMMMIRLLDDPLTLHRISYALLQLDRYDRAQVVLERLIEVDPEEPVGYYNLGILHWRLDRHHLAIPCFEHIVAHDSTYGDAWLCLGFIHMEIGEVETAWQIQTRLLAMSHEGAERLQAALVEYEAERSDPVSEWW